MTDPQGRIQRGVLNVNQGRSQDSLEIPGNLLEKNSYNSSKMFGFKKTPSKKILDTPILQPWISFKKSKFHLFYILE
jgi:hypothetical protein